MSNSPKGKRQIQDLFLRRKKDLRSFFREKKNLRFFFSTSAVENRKRFSTAEERLLRFRRNRRRPVFSNSFGIRENEGLLNMYIFFFANVQILRIWTFVSFILTARHANLTFVPRKLYAIFGGPNGFAGACLRRIREIRDRSFPFLMGPDQRSGPVRNEKRAIFDFSIEDFSFHRNRRNGMKKTFGASIDFIENHTSIKNGKQMTPGGPDLWSAPPLRSCFPLFL